MSHTGSCCHVRDVAVLLCHWGCDTIAVTFVTLLCYCAIGDVTQLLSRS